MTFLLGIDIGTSTVKAVLFESDSARTVAVAGHEYPIHKPAPDRAEQDPEDWWRATVEVVRRVTAEYKNISAIGFSGQMHGGLLLDEHHKPLHHAIIWADQRSAVTTQQLVEKIGETEFLQRAGTLPAAGFMISTLAWLVEHDPALLERAHHVILPKDYVRLHMTGELATDYSDASATGCFNQGKLAWSNHLIKAAGIPLKIFPRVIASTDVAGTLTRGAADELGLKAGIRVVGGSADQPAQAVGSGLVTPGRASVTTGTGGQVFVPIKHYRTGDARLHIFRHAAPDMHYILGAIMSAGVALRWLRNLVGLAHEPDAYPILSAEAAQIAPGADGLLFLPYLSGERTPHMDPFARGAFVGLNYHHGRAHLARAVMEGVSFALRQALEISLSLGATADMIIVAGGGAESDVWRQMQADVFGIPLRKSLLIEQASIGAALLGGVGAGVYRDLEQACSQVVRYGAVTEPDAARHAQYNELYTQFLGLYPTLRSDMHTLARHIE